MRDYKFEPHVDGRITPDYGAHYYLGERDDRLRGIMLDVSTNVENAVRITKGSTADSPLTDALKAEMVNSGKFYQGGPEGPDEFVYVGRDHNPVGAVQELMQTEKMAKFAEMRRPAMEKAKENRLAELKKSNDAAWEALQAANQASAEKDEQAMAAAQEKLDDAAEA